jgi:hypothetical protein
MARALYLSCATCAGAVRYDFDRKRKLAVRKSYTISQLGGFSPPAVVKSITADERGYISLHFDEGFYVFDPTGALEEDGGGDADLVGTRNAWKP